jgi:hypothetical protein
MAKAKVLSTRAKDALAKIISHGLVSVIDFEVTRPIDGVSIQDVTTLVKEGWLDFDEKASSDRLLVYKPCKVAAEALMEKPPADQPDNKVGKWLVFSWHEYGQSKISPQVATAQIIAQSDRTRRGYGAKKGDTEMYYKVVSARTRWAGDRNGYVDPEYQVAIVDTEDEANAMVARFAEANTMTKSARRLESHVADCVSRLLDKEVEGAGRHALKGEPLGQIYVLEDFKRAIAVIEQSTKNVLTGIEQIIAESEEDEG